VSALDILSAEDVLRMADAQSQSRREPVPVELSSQDLEDVTDEDTAASTMAAIAAAPLVAGPATALADDELAPQKRPSLSESQAAAAVSQADDDLATERRPSLSMEQAEAQLAQTDAPRAPGVTSTAKMPAYASDSRIPSSIAPMALDAETPSHRGVSMATMKLRVDAGLPAPLSERALVGMVAGCALLGLMCTASLGAYLLRGRSNVQSAQMGLVASPPTGELLAAPAAAPLPAEPQVAPLPEPPAPVVVQVAPVPAPVAPKASPAPVKPVVKAAPTSAKATPNQNITAAAPKPVVAPPAAAPALGGTKSAAPALGSVRLPAGSNAAEVDGNVQRATNGVLVLTCGKHRIKVAGRPQRLLDVPCGKTTAM
jgi:hypothetical protein